ncbi:kinase-like domain-containing protein [Scleroderma citrinum]
MSEILSTLKQVADTASTNGVDLNDLVDRDESFHPNHGGYSIVYKGILHPGQVIAIKSVRLSPLSDQAAVDFIIEEIRLWSKLDHDHIVPVFGVITKFDFSVSIAYAWMPKGNAYDYVQNKDIDPRPLLLGIARGLEYLHNHDLGPLVHGDLRGKNVLISEDGRALLTDYRLSSVIETAFSLTAAAPIHPTVRWLSPEQIRNDGKATTQADVWAFGMTALELFTRMPPYHDVRDTRSIMLRITDGPPSRPSNESTCSRMTEMWWEVCTQCWERNESLRSPISDIVKKIMTITPVSRQQSFFTTAHAILVSYFGYISSLALLWG